MNLTNQQIETEFKRQVKLCCSIGKYAMMKIINDMFPACPEYFLVIGTTDIYECVGNDDGKYWAELDGVSTGFDQQECIIVTELTVDKDTLPKDNQRIKFEIYDHWYEGVFISGDDLFFINKGKWFNSWEVIRWYPL